MYIISAPPHQPFARRRVKQHSISDGGDTCCYSLALSDNLGAFGIRLDGRRDTHRADGRSRLLPVNAAAGYAKCHPCDERQTRPEVLHEIPSLHLILLTSKAN